MLFKRRPALSPFSPPVNTSRPWSMTIVSQGEWSALTHKLSDGLFNLLSLWSDGRFVFMALRSKEDLKIELFGLDCPHGNFPSVGRLHPPAIRL